MVSYRTQLLHVICPDGGGFRNVMAGLTATPSVPRGTRTISSIWFAVEDRGGDQQLLGLAEDGKVKPGSNGLHRMELAGIARKGGYGVAIRSTTSLPWNVRFPL